MGTKTVETILSELSPEPQRHLARDNPAVLPIPLQLEVS
ncbi:hypothetical protein F8B43_3695 [Methylorubrum populi]|uniref:Uncharacterized protein n=1 Tax=Methylorubrum populi TaxID=223967 RepID=A0A833J3H7_9HYPH|nr:hypothetical protein F8B43_3695 [Methylorubrum populi]